MTEIETVIGVETDDEVAQTENIAVAAGAEAEVEAESATDAEKETDVGTVAEVDRVQRRGNLRTENTKGKDRMWKAETIVENLPNDEIRSQVAQPQRSHQR